MSRQRFSIPLLLFLLACTVGSRAAPEPPQQVRDLHYGEVLFHFYQQDYFTAITRLMMASEQQQLQHHENEAELLLGGLQLSYGMLDQAEARFRRLIGPDTDPETKSRAWFYLARIAYQRGLFRKARSALQEAGLPDNPGQRAELLLLTANVRMALGENNEAAEALSDARAPEDWHEYLRINRGIALLRAGHTSEGREVLDQLGQSRAGNEELRALRDRANTGLGYELLRAGEAGQARDYLGRVRLSGPYMQAALLGAGWADADLGHYEEALVPWLKLLEQSSFDAPVQEAQLAVPYAFTKLGDNQRAIHFYEAAIAHYDRQQQDLDTAIDSVQSGAMLALLDQADTGTSGGWLHANPELKNAPADRYLVDVLSGNRFQETLKDYRDLGYLNVLLGEWQENIGVYYDMVDARRLAYQQREPLIRAQLEQNSARSLGERWQQYRQKLDRLQADDDPQGLATGKEQQQWQMLEQLQARLAAMPGNPRQEKMLERAKWLQGVLYWQIQADYKTRLWKIRKQLGALESGVAEATQRHEQVSTALSNVRNGFAGYEQRIEVLRKRIFALQPDIRQARTDASVVLRQLALQELEQRRQRLASYRSQARYALARTYDQLAHNGEPG